MTVRRRILSSELRVSNRELYLEINKRLYDTIKTGGYDDEIWIEYIKGWAEIEKVEGGYLVIKGDKKIGVYLDDYTT